MLVLAGLGALVAGWRHRAEVLTAAALLAGWFWITLGIATLSSRAVWPISTGVLLIAGCGIRFTAGVAWAGLYVLTRKRPNA